jgi:hypothetical protein
MMKTMIAVTLALAALMLGLDKVRNEHAMTREYRRQADALERIADAARVGSFGATARRWRRWRCGTTAAELKNLTASRRRLSGLGPRQTKKDCTSGSSYRVRA